MQISTHELIKLLAENEKRATEALLCKIKNEVKPKRNLVKIEVVYEFYDCIKDVSTYSYNIITTAEVCDPVKVVMENIQAHFLLEDISIEYNPASICYDGYKNTKADGIIRVFTIRNIRDCIIDRI